MSRIYEIMRPYLPLVAIALLAVLSLLLQTCTAPAHLLETEAERDGDEIVVCGHYVSTGTPVVLWSDPEGYDAYSEVPRFTEPKLGTNGESTRKKRYGTRKAPAEIASRVAASGWQLEDLQQVVTKFVLHYDVAGTSRQCFKILQDMRNLSVHFMIDVDGTIYQTLDLQERAWHSGTSNDDSVGVEIAHIGAHPSPGATYMRWYKKDDAGGRYVKFPKWMKETGIRTADFIARPARPGVIQGRINGRKLYQYDYTEAQYQALIKLTAALHRALPRIELDAPRSADGAIRPEVLTAPQRRAFTGVLGHYHVKKGKSDPGPAMDWNRVLEGARAAAKQ